MCGQVRATLPGDFTIKKPSCVAGRPHGVCSQLFSELGIDVEADGIIELPR